MSVKSELEECALACQGLLFTGWYTDRIHVEEVNGYRDRVKVDEVEVEVAKHCKGVVKKAKKEAKFTALEKCGNTWSFLVDLSSSHHPFGHYWFYVERVAIGKERLLWQLKIVRPVLKGDEKSSDKCPHCGKFPTSDGDDPKAQDEPLNISEIADKLQQNFKEYINPIDWYNGARPYITIENFVKVIKFLVILLMALVSGAANLMPKILHHLSTLVRESGFLVRQFMPFLLACVEMVNKMVGGFYLLIAMMWRDARKGPADQSQTNALEGPRSYPYKRELQQRPYYRRKME